MSRRRRRITETQLEVAALEISRFFPLSTADEPYFAARAALTRLGFTAPRLVPTPPYPGGQDPWAHLRFGDDHEARDHAANSDDYDEPDDYDATDDAECDDECFGIHVRGDGEHYTCDGRPV